MTDNLNIEAQIDLNNQKAIRAINDLITKLGDLQRSGPEAAKAIDAVERSAVKIAGALASGTSSIHKQTQAIKELQAAYRALSAQGLKGTGSITTRLNNAMGSDSQIRVLQQQEAAYKSYYKNIEAAQRSSLQRQQQAAFQTYAQNMPRALQATQRAAYDSYKTNIAYTKQLEEGNRALANQRYALYDVATSFAAVSLATLGASFAATKIGVDYQAAFSQVERTTQASGKQLDTLRQQLIELSTSVPIGFEQLSEIAALGGQLGVATTGIDDFTEVVAKLTATTNLTAEAAGTALGRFDALFQDIDPSKFEALGSAILKVGVNSVATESQIVNTATQISSMGDFAGLTAEQVVGLSGALASVGAQPELARGTVTRVFTLMSGAVSAGGDSLEEFARISGVSAQEFQSAWGTDRFASVFQKFLAGIASEGQGAVSTLNDLGVSSVRDVPLLLRLAGAQDVVRRAFADSASGFKDNTELNKQYDITLGTVAAQLTIFGNTLKAVLETAGGAALGPLAGVLGVFQNLADIILQIGSTGAGKVIGVIVLALTGLIGVLTGLRAIQALSTASAYAFITAQEALGKAGLGSTTAMGGLAKQMAAVTLGTTRATAATAAYTAAASAGAGRVGAFGAGVKGAVTAVNGLGGALRSAAVAGGWLTAIGLGISLLTSYAQKQQEAKVQVEGLTQTLDAQTGALTNLTRAQVFKNLVDDGTVAKAKALGLDLQLVTDAALGNKDAISQLTAIQGQYQDATQAAIDNNTYYNLSNQDLKESLADIGAVLTSVGINSEQVADAQEAFGDAARAGAGAMDQQTDSATDLVGSLQDMIDVQYDLVGGTVAVQNAIYALGSSLGENGADFSAYSVAGRENLAALQSALAAMVQASGGDADALATMVAGLMQTLASYGVDTVNQLAFVQRALAQLTGGKGIGGLVGVQDAAAQAGNALGQGFSSGAGKAAKSASRASKAANSAAKEVKTLSDYASELSGVFKTSFDIRFGLEESLDAVADGWQKMRDSAQDARDAIVDATQELVDADATIQGLKAANNTLTFQLSVAQQYGDVLRATEIMAEIAENNAEIADEQKGRTKTEKELAKAQAAATPILDGQTEASREQRDMVLGLVKSYQDQVTALANSGLSTQEVARRTQELKQQFVAQLTQMGYNRAEISRYAASFDDLTLAIQRVPRNITVSANTDPAQRAIDEFLAKNANRTTTVGVNPTGGGYSDGYSAGQSYAQGWVDATNRGRRLVVAQDNRVPGGQTYRTVDASGNYGPVFFQKGGQVQYRASGGGIGHPGNPKGTDTVPAWLTPGEFVQKTQAVNYYGLPFMNALNNMQIPRYLSTGGPASGRGATSSGPSIQLVELLPNQVAQIVNGLAVQLSVDGKVIADTANNTNYASARRGSN